MLRLFFLAGVAVVVMVAVGLYQRHCAHGFWQQSGGRQQAAPHPTGRHPDQHAPAHAGLLPAAGL
jgi:hypothetical protein